MLEILALCSCACIVCIWCTAAFGSSKTKYCLKRSLLLSDSRKCFHPCTKCSSKSCTNLSSDSYKKRTRFLCPLRSKFLPYNRPQHKCNSSARKYCYNTSCSFLSSTVEDYFGCKKCRKKLVNLNQKFQEIKASLTMHRDHPFFLDHSSEMKTNLDLEPSRPSKNDCFMNNIPQGTKPVLMLKSSLHSLSRSFAQTHTYCRTEHQEKSKKLQKAFKPKNSAFLNAQTQYSTPECVMKSSSEATFNAANHPQKLKSNQFPSCCNPNYSQPFKKVPWTSYNSRSTSLSHMNQTPPIFLNYKLMCKICLQEKYRCICSKIYCG